MVVASLLEKLPTIGYGDITWDDASFGKTEDELIFRSL